LSGLLRRARSYSRWPRRSGPRGPARRPNSNAPARNRLGGEVFAIRADRAIQIACLLQGNGMLEKRFGLAAGCAQRAEARRPMMTQSEVNVVTGLSHQPISSGGRIRLVRGPLRPFCRHGVSCRQRQAHLRTVAACCRAISSSLIPCSTSPSLASSLPSTAWAPEELRTRLHRAPRVRKWLYLNRRAPHTPRQRSSGPPYVSGSAPVLSDIRADSHPYRSLPGTTHRDSGRWEPLG